MKPVISSSKPQLRLSILLLPQFTLSAFALFLDPIRLASDDRDGSRQVRCQWRVMTLNGLPVRSSCGVEIYPTAKDRDYLDADWLIVVGGLMHASAHTDDRVLDTIRRAADKDVRVIGLCTGVFSMASAGILNGERCCVSWFHADEFAALFDSVLADTTNLYHFGARHVTCAGGIGSVHVALEIIRQSLGEEIARKSAGILMVPRYWSQNLEQPVTQIYGGASGKVREALRFMELNIENAPAMPEIAVAVGISVRQLERLFKRDIGKSPQKVMEILQIEKACIHIAETDWSMIEVSLACGFANPSHFAASFKAAKGVSPSAYRKNLSVSTL